MLCRFYKMWYRTCYKLKNCPLVKNLIRIRLKHEWALPTGHDTGISVYNIYCRKKVPLIFCNKNLVTWYICGPTVYDTSHIGHASCYVRFDTIRRILDNYFGIKPIIALGVTDVSEKICQKSEELNEPCIEIARRYEREFFHQLELLNVIPPTLRMRVSDFIPEIIRFVEKILEKNAAYVNSDGTVYYDTSADKNYGRFHNIPPENTSKLIKDKKNYSDFALWRSANGNDGVWNSPWGRGRPGWHIECSTMASHIFGSNMDLHSGGSDLIFPHHENEEAQSCCYHDNKQWANYWLHTGLLQQDEEKMSKSLMNYIPITELLQSFSSDHFRMFCSMTHYRQNLNYSPDAMRKAASKYNALTENLKYFEDYIYGNLASGNVEEARLLSEMEETERQVSKHLKNDFDIPSSLSVVMNLAENTKNMICPKSDSLVSRSPAAVASVYLYIKEFFKTMGFTVGETRNKTEDVYNIKDILDAAVDFRHKVRITGLKSSNVDTKKELLTYCDDFRKNLGASGVIIKDQKTSNSFWFLSDKP